MTNLKNDHKHRDASQDVGHPAPQLEARDKGALSRRGFVGGAIGAGIVAIGATLGCSGNGNFSKTSLDEAVEGVANTEGGMRVMPASSMAQSLLSSLAPENLVSIVGDYSVGEQPEAIDASELPCTGAFSEEGIGAFGQMISAFSPDLVLDVGLYEQSRAEALQKSQEATGIPHVLVNLKEIALSDAVPSLAQMLKVEDIDSKVGIFKRIESVLEKASSIPENERFMVYLGGGEDGFSAFGEGAVENRVLKNAGAIPYMVEGIESESGYAESSTFANERALDMVFLIDRTAGMDFASDGYMTGSWGVFQVGRMGCVFPALAAGRVWLGEMSSFAKVTLGAAWLAAILYPDAVGVDADEIVESFYMTLFGDVPEKDASADACKALFEARLPLSKSDLDAEVSAFREQRESDALSMQKGLREANDPSNYSDDELRQIYKTFCRIAGNEPTEEGVQAYISAVRSM